MISIYPLPCGILGQKFTKCLDPGNSIRRGIPASAPDIFVRGVSYVAYLRRAERMEKEDSFNCDTPIWQGTRGLAARRAMKRFGMNRTQWQW